MMSTFIWCSMTSAGGWPRLAGKRRGERRSADSGHRPARRTVFKPREGRCLHTAEGWSRDVSEEIANEIGERCARDGSDVPAVLEAFVERHGGGWPAQLPLPLRGAA